MGSRYNFYFAPLSVFYFKQETHRITEHLKLTLFTFVRTENQGNGKGLPMTGHEGPEVEQMYGSTLPSTSALDTVGSQRHAPGRFTLRKDPVPIVQAAGWTPGLVWTDAGNLTPTGI